METTPRIVQGGQLVQRHLIVGLPSARPGEHPDPLRPVRTVRIGLDPRISRGRGP